jgi:predicted hydrolase (HD superfamily)
MDRNELVAKVKAHLEQNIFFHSLAVEACMDGVYEYLKVQHELGSDEPPKEDWLTAGLIHDIDYAGEFKEFHPQKTKEACEKTGIELTSSVEAIIKAHAPKLTGATPETKAQWAIYCSDSLTGLITAVSLVYPTKKLADVKLPSVMKRFLHQPKFAAGTRRQEIKECEKPEGLNIPLETFVGICLSSIQGIASEIGL